jgi:ferritin-like metal-binding protein YciE
MAQNKEKARAKNNGEGVTGLRALLVMRVKGLYDIQSEFAELLDVMAKKTNDADLKECLEDQSERTVLQAERMISAFEALEVKPQKLPDAMIRALATDVAWLVKNVKHPETLDAGLLAAARAGLHHEIASFDSAIGWAKLLEEDDVADVLEETLDEDEEADEELADLAESTINEAALPEHDDSEDDEEEEEAEE